MRSSESQAAVNPCAVTGNESIALQQEAAFVKDFAPILLPANARASRRQKDRERLLPVAEVARILGVCDATVYKLCERGHLGHVRILNAIRVPPASLAAFVASRARFLGNF
jgi:excisionase family DNA binding protein